MLIKIKKTKKQKSKKIKKSTDANKGDIVSQIKGLKELLNAGAITQDEFDKIMNKKSEEMMERMQSRRGDGENVIIRIGG